MLRAIDMLKHSDEADILLSVRDLLGVIKAPLAELKEAQRAMLDRDSDYLSRGALKQLEDRNKRELTARERSGIMEALACVRSLLRDVLLLVQDDAASIVNEDARDIACRLAGHATCTGIVRAIEAVGDAEHRIARNITPQLTCEVMLFDIRKALLCP